MVQRILVVDDDQGIVRLVRAYLEAVNNIETHRRTHPGEQFYINGEDLWWE